MTIALEQPKETLFTRFIKYTNGKVKFIDEETNVIKCMGIYYVDLGTPEGSVQGGVRPCLVISNNRNNKYSSNIVVIPFTSKIKNSLPVHVNFSNEVGLNRESTLLCEQIITIPKNKIKDNIGEITKWLDAVKIIKALFIQLPIFNILGIVL